MKSKIERARYKDYTAATTMGQIFDDYPVIEKIYTKAGEEKRTLLSVVNEAIGEERFTGNQLLNPELIGEIVEALSEVNYV